MHVSKVRVSTLRIVRPTRPPRLLQNACVRPGHRVGRSDPPERRRRGVCERAPLVSTCARGLAFCYGPDRMCMDRKSGPGGATLPKSIVRGDWKFGGRKL